MRLRRELRWFDKTSEECAGWCELVGVRLDELQRVFGVAQEDSMYGCFPVSEHHVAYLAAYAQVPIDLDRYDYFVECSAVNDSENS
jgi:hypothetical protein